MVISKMDKYIHKTKPPNFGGFFVASHKTKPLIVGAYQGFLLSSRRENTRGTCLNFSIKTLSKVTGNMDKQHGLLVGSGICAFLVCLGAAAIIFALRW